MAIDHLLNDKMMKNLYGPQSGIGDKRIYLAEMPFVTIQGEGPNIGKNTLFIRFFGCNLANSCGVDWCDSGHSFYTDKEAPKNDKGEVSEYPQKSDRVTFSDINQFFDKVFVESMAEFNNVVFTGGEPMMWQMTIAHIIRMCRDKNMGYAFEVETNGTIPIESELSDYFKLVHFNISPKVHVAKKFALIGQLNKEYSYNGKAAKVNHDDWIIKFVWEREKTLQSILDCVTQYKIPKNKIYFMPEGKSTVEQNEKMKECAEYCINNGYNFSARLHVLIWNTKKGV